MTGGTSITASITAWLMPHLILAPIALPLLTAGLMLLLREERQRTKVTLNITSTFLGLVVAVLLLVQAKDPNLPGGLGVSLPGNWPAPFGIVLTIDRLSAMMLVLCSTVALATVLFSAARWHRAGVPFHPLFLFLLGVSMLYGITGTLNMADLAQSIAGIAPADRGLLHAAAAILAVAFLIKAAVWPLNFWLVPAYSAATAPVGALFALMTKVGVYSVLRLWTLLFGAEAGESAQFGSQWLIGGGLLTMAFGAIGMLGSQRLGHLAGFSAVLSSGTLLAAVGFGQNLLTGGLLYYLLSSTLAVSALFLLTDLIDRWRNDGSNLAPYEQPDDAPFLSADLVPTEGMNLDDKEEALIGEVIPAAAAFLGLAFIACTLVIAGLPPLPGFVGKFAMVHALLNPLGLGTSSGFQLGAAGWTLVALLVASGLLALVALTRAGIRHFWAAHDRSAPKLLVLEGLPIALLLGACAALAWQAGAVMRYTQATADALHAPAGYMRAVMATEPVPNPPKPATPRRGTLP